MDLSSVVVKGAPENGLKQAEQTLSRIADNLYRSNVTNTIYGIFTVNGRQLRKSLKTSNKEIARKRLEKFRAEILEADTKRRDAELSSLSFTEVAGRWLQSVEAAIAPRTAENCRWCIKALANHFPYNLATITSADVDIWSVRRSRETEPSTFNKETAILRRVLAFAIERGAILRNPAAHLKHRRVPKPRIAVPTREQFHLLLAELRRDYRSQGAGDLVEFLAASGCRLGEAVSIRWRDVDFQRGTLTIGANGKTKNGEARTVPLFPPLRAFLEALRSRNADAEPDATLLPIKNAKVAITNACRRLGLPVFSHHKFRHLFCTTALESGVPPHVIAAWAGHKDGGQLVCRTYGHVRSEASELFAQKVNKIPIVHLHGQLNGLCPMKSGRPYSPKADYRQVKLSMAEIKIIHELGTDAMKLPQFKEALSLLEKAETICFIGFGYLKANLERLNVPKWGTNNICGTGYGLTASEQKQIRDFIANKRSMSGLLIPLGNTQHEALQFCREVGIFPMA